MMTAEQFETPRDERFELGDFGQANLGSEAFALNVLSLLQEPTQSVVEEPADVGESADNIDRDFAELSPKCSARSSDHVIVRIR